MLPIRYTVIHDAPYFYLPSQGPGALQEQFAQLKLPSSLWGVSLSENGVTLEYKLHLEARSTSDLDLACATFSCHCDSARDCTCTKPNAYWNTTKIICWDGRLLRSANFVKYHNNGVCTSEILSCLQGRATEIAPGLAYLSPFGFYGGGVSLAPENERDRRATQRTSAANGWKLRKKRAKFCEPCIWNSACGKRAPSSACSVASATELANLSGKTTPDLGKVREALSVLPPDAQIVRHRGRQYTGLMVDKFGNYVAVEQNLRRRWAGSVASAVNRELRANSLQPIKVGAGGDDVVLRLDRPGAERLGFKFCEPVPVQTSAVHSLGLLLGLHSILFGSVWVEDGEVLHFKYESRSWRRHWQFDSVDKSDWGKIWNKGWTQYNHPACFKQILRAQAWKGTK